MQIKRIRVLGQEQGLKHPELYSYDWIETKLSRDIPEYYVNSPKPVAIQAMFCMLYGYALRVSELILIRKQDCILDRDGTILKVSSPSLKKRGSKKKILKAPIETGDRYYHDLEIINPRQFTKDIPVSRSQESFITEPILKYLKTLKDDKDVLFPYSRMKVFRYCLRTFNFNPHGLRKIRLTHLVTKFNFTDRQLVQFAGWENALPAGAYVKLRYDDIIPIKGRLPYGGTEQRTESQLRGQTENNVQD